MAFLGSAIIWLAYPSLAKAGFIGLALVYLLAGLAMYVLLRKLVEEKPKSAMKSAGRRKKGNVSFMIEESGSYYRDPVYANERKEEKNRREAIRIGHRTTELESSEEEEEMDEYVTYPKELIREGIEFLDEIGQVPDALYRPLSGKQNSFNFVIFWFAQHTVCSQLISSAAPLYPISRPSCFGNLLHSFHHFFSLETCHQMLDSKQHMLTPIQSTSS
jgi:hypothetical protein